MTKPIIEVQGIGKRYEIGLERDNSLRDRIVRQMNAQSRRAATAASEFWALRDVSFEVQPGWTMGMIGRNGAGKSTMLKLLSQITPPTEGRIVMRGRVASLLEVGTGFHPELTGRENVYLNGAILGMTRAQIKSKFDEIVSFAEADKFLDTPVKRYSSGMYVRLAFAVAAHLEPDILVVDEVLAVGDAAFQKKCLGKMGDVARGGRTVIFVSHSMDSIRRLCNQAVWLDHGHVHAVGDVNSCVTDYLTQDIREGAAATFDPPLPMPNGMSVTFRSVAIMDETPINKTLFSTASPLRIEIEWESHEPILKPRIGFILQTADGSDILTVLDANSWSEGRLSPGRRVSRCVIPGSLLNEGDYLIELAGDGLPGFDLQKSRTGGVLRFTMEDDMTLPNKYYGEEGFRDARWPGVLLMNIPWTTDSVSSERTEVRALRDEDEAV